MHKNKVDISVVVAFFNGEQYIEQTIESILNQTYDSWELILVDDGSNDNSTQIAKSYANHFSEKIKYQEHSNHENKGLSASRNFGIENAAGRWIAFLDADDIWKPHYLEMQVQILKANKVAMVCEATKYWYSWADKNKQDSIIYVGVEQDRIYKPLELSKRLYPLGNGDAPCMCGIVIEKSIVLKYNGFDESFIGMYEDQVFLSKIYLYEKIYISSHCNNLYRQRPDSMMTISHKRGEYKSIRGRFLLWYNNYILQNKIEDREIWSLVDDSLFSYRYPLVDFFLSYTKKVKNKLIRLFN